MKLEQMDYDNKGTKAWRFFCPGCQSCHAAVEGRWTFNGDMEKPTFSPSLLVRWTKITEKGWAEISEWEAAGKPSRTEPFDNIKMVCHSFVTNGEIQFLNDSTHELAGKIVTLPDVD